MSTYMYIYSHLFLTYYKIISFYANEESGCWRVEAKGTFPVMSLFHYDIWPWAGRMGKKCHSGVKYSLINCEYFSRPSLNTCTSWQDRETLINRGVSTEKKLVQNSSW